MFLGSPNGRDGPDSAQDPQLPKTRRLREVPNNERSFLSSSFFFKVFFDVDDFIIFFEFGGSDSKESACSVGDWGLIPGSRRSLNKGMAACSSIPGASQVVQW